MAPVLCLLVVVGVEVDVVEDDGVGGRQVDAQPARLRRQDEEENTVVRVELVYQVLPANARGESFCSAQFSVRGCVRLAPVPICFAVVSMETYSRNTSSTILSALEYEGKSTGFFQLVISTLYLNLLCSLHTATLLSVFGGQERPREEITSQTCSPLLDGGGSIEP